jgi:catechol 2,3-dioxygenase-like lactoylglutathione lyase family enzyme
VKVLRLCWLGIPTKEYAPMVAFLRDVFGLRVEFERQTTTELSLPSGDRVQIFAPEDPFSERFAAAVALFEVESLDDAQRELATRGIDVVGAAEHDSEWRWINVRAPDGTLFELAERRHDAS